MLVLTRRANETIHIGNDVEVTVCGVDAGGKVKVGVTAPSHVHILRGELAGTDKQPEPAQPAA